MEADVQAKLIRGALTVMGLALVALSAGCVETKSFLNWADCPPKGEVHQLAMTWKSEVMTSPDPTRNGSPTPVFAGRLYLFGQNLDYPLECDGNVIVECFNETPGTEPILLERWQLDRDTVKRLKRKDIVGWGYTLILPWGSQRPDITQVRMKVIYEPARGNPLFADNIVTVGAVQEFQVGVKTTPANTSTTNPPTATVAQPKPADAKPTGIQPASGVESRSVGTIPFNPRR